MKRIVVLLFAILSIALYSQEVIEVTDSDKLKKFNLKLFEVEYNGDGTIDKETGFMRINSSENFNSEYKDAKDIAMDYLKNKLNTYGLTELNQFRIRKVAESLTGEFVYFSQYINDIPVYQTNFTVFIDKNKTVRFVSNGFRNISKEQEISLESLPKETGYNEAIDIAKKYLNVLEPSNIIREPAGWLTYFESKDKGLLLTWAVNVSCYKPAGSWYVFIDANDKQVVHIEDHTDHYTTYVDVPALVHNPTNMFDAANAYLESSKYYENGKYYCTVFNTLNEFGLIANPNLACSIIGNSNFNSSITDNNVIIQNANINNGVMEVKACNDVTIDNSTIKQGTTLKVKATQGQTTINDFIVEEGAVFVVE